MSFLLSQIKYFYNNHIATLSGEDIYDFTVRQIKNFFSTRIGWTLVFVNLFLAIWGLREKGWQFSGYHFIYEPVTIKLLTFLHLPIIVIAESISRALFPLPDSNFKDGTIHNFDMFLIVLFSVFQWLLIGYLCNVLFSKKLK